MLAFTLQAHGAPNTDCREKRKPPKLAPEEPRGTNTHGRSSGARQPSQEQSVAFDTFRVSLLELDSLSIFLKKESSQENLGFFFSFKKKKSGSLHGDTISVLRSGWPLPIAAKPSGILRTFWALLAWSSFSLSSIPWILIQAVLKTRGTVEAQVSVGLVDSSSEMLKEQPGLGEKIQREENEVTAMGKTLIT